MKIKLIFIALFFLNLAMFSAQKKKSKSKKNQKQEQTLKTQEQREQELKKQEEQKQKEEEKKQEYLEVWENVENILALPKSLNLHNNEYFLAESKEMSKTYKIQSYLLKEETTRVFSEKVTFNYFDKEIDMQLAVRQKVDDIQRIKEFDKFAEVNLIQNPEGTEYVVDYSRSFPDDDVEKSYIEYQIYRFKPLKEGKAMLIFVYSKKYFGDFKIGKKMLERERGRLLSEVIKYQLPIITI